MTENRRERRHFGFELLDRGGEREIAQVLQAARERRRMKPLILDALRLYRSLQRGDVETLVEFFPRTYSKLHSYYNSVE